MTPAKILIIAIISLTIFFIGMAVAESDCGCNAEPDGGWGAPDYSDDPSWGQSFDDLTDGSSTGGSGSSSGSTDTGGADTSSGSSGSGSSSGGSSSDSGSSSSPSSGSAEEGIIWRMKGDDLFEKGLFNESLDAYKKATGNDPYATKSWIGTGRVLLALGNPGGAAEAFRKAIRLDPGNAETFVLLGDALSTAGSYDDAVTQYLKALALNPNLLEVKGKITLAETATVMVNVTGEGTPGMTKEIPPSEAATMATTDLSPGTTPPATDLPVTPKASLPGLAGILTALLTGFALFILRKR